MSALLLPAVRRFRVKSGVASGRKKRFKSELRQQLAQSTRRLRRRTGLSRWDAHAAYKTRQQVMFFLLPANFLLAIIFPGKRLQSWLNCSSTKTKHQMKGRLLLDVVVGQRSPVLELLTGEDQPLLIWRDTFLILNLALHVLDGIRRLHLERDRLPRHCIHDNLDLSLNE